jgi:hypothetical protein
VIGWRQSKTTGETLHEKVLIWQFARFDDGLLSGEDPECDPTSAFNDMEMKREAEQKKLYRIAKVYNFVEIWQGSHNLRATQQESHAHK